ncbi:ATP-binding cassette sub-family A member 13 [Heteronotia binoei]|uniref:ATP-binding cassette sub-family A member 13 n=1 Tax=Heteronotia binoei TaxID=13085 RepID=UPI00292F34B9|nr:ATP-binding cassette sub-family A member 13 [Heteronotia binoei]
MACLKPPKKFAAEVLSLSEVLWPCTLFLILAVVRFQEPPRQRENCYLAARDLPSRGLYPFVQSLFCNGGSRCKNSSYTAQKNSSLRASSSQRDHNSIMDPDVAFLKDIKELMQGISETTKKAATLHTLWEERSKLLDPAGSSVFLGMNLNETEQMISTVEHFHNQPYFWDLLYSLPWLQRGSLSQERGIEYLAKLLRTVQNSLAFLEDLNATPSTQKSYSVLKLGLTVMTAVLEAWNGEGFQYILCLGDIVWIPSVKTELQSQLGFEKIYIERILNYTVRLNKIPTKDTLEQLVCSILSTVSEAKPDKGDGDERDCIFSPWLEAQTYLVHSVDQIKLYTKILERDASSACDDDLIAFERSLGLPQDSELRDVLEELVCRQNHSEFRSQIHLVKKSIQLLQSTIHGHRSLPVSLAEGYLGWRAIGERLAETSASCSEIMKFLSKTQHVQAASFSSCHEQLVQSLFWDTLDELWFGFEKQLYWKGLSTFVRRTCEMAYYANEGEGFLRGQPEFIQEIFLPNSSVLLNSPDFQSFVETILDNVVFLMNSLGTIEEEEDVQSLPELAAQILKNFQQLPAFGQRHETNVFLQIMEMLLRELDPKQPHIWRTADPVEQVEEQLDTLYRAARPDVLENQNILNRSLQVFQHLLADWPELTVFNGDYANDLSEHFIKVLYEIGLLAPEQTASAFSTIYTVKNVLSFLVSNASSSLKMRDLESVVSNFYQKISRVGGSHAAVLVQTLSSLYQDTEQFLKQGDGSLVTFLYQNSKNRSTPFPLLDFRGVSQAFEFLSGTAKLLQHFPQESICEKLLKLYNHTELQVQSMGQDGERETEAATRMMNSSKAILFGMERCIGAFQHLKNFFGTPAENAFRNASSDFSTSEFPSTNRSSSFMILLADLFSSMSPVGNMTNRLLPLNCHKAWIQMWLKFLEEVSKMLRLDSGFLTDFHNAWVLSLDSLESSNLAKTCNKTIAIEGQLRSVVHLLKGITKVSHMIDFEALNHFSAALSHVSNITSSYSKGDLQEVMHLVEGISVELHKVVSNANFSRDFLESWLDIFTPASSKAEHKLNSLGKSISHILSWEEIETSFVELEETAELLKNVSQDQNILSCAEILKNVTQRMRNEDLSGQDISQRWLPELLKFLLTFENATISLKSCHTLGLLIKTLIEKYSIFSPKNAKDVLILLTSLSPIDDSSNKLENIPNILDMAFNFTKWPCLQNGTNAHLTNHCVNLVTEYLKLILPAFSEQVDLQVVDSIFNHLKYTGGQIKNIIQDLTDRSLDALDSNQTAFLEPIMNSTEFLGFLHQFWPSPVGLLSDIQTLLKNVSTEYFQNGTFPWHTGILLKALGSSPKYIINLLRAPLHYFNAISNILSMTSHAEDSTSSFDPELARKVLQMLRSYILPNSLQELDAEVFRKYMIALLHNLEKTDANVRQLGQISRSQNSMDHEGQYAENSLLDFLAGWFKNISNALTSWNSTTVGQIMKLFQEAELAEVVQELHYLSEVVNLFERVAHKNMTDALIEGYRFMLKHSTDVAALSTEDLSKEVNSLVELLELATEMPLESAEALNCLSAVICWNITERSSQDEPVSKACSVDLQKNASTVYEMTAEMIEQLQIQEESLCSDERFLKEVTSKMACFLGRLEEWHPVILKLFEFHPLDSSILNEVVSFWSKLSDYVLTSRANRSNLSHCMLMGKEQTSLQLIEAVSNMISSETGAVGALFEQLTDFFGSQKPERSTEARRIKTILTHLRHVANGTFGLNDTKDTLTSFLSSVQPLMALSPAGNQLHLVLRTLLALARNRSLREGLEALWLETERGVENLSSDFNVRQLLLLIAKEFHLLSTTVELNTLSVLVSALRPLNTSFLQSFEDVLEQGRKWLEEHHNKNFSKIINALILLAAGQKSSDEILQSIKDIISFLELFKNETKGDDPLSFIIDFLSGKKLKNVQVAHLILENSLLDVIRDLTAKEEELYSNNTDDQIMEFIDLFFDDTYYENYGKDIAPSQSKAMELIKEFLQIVFPSSTERSRNKIFFLLKDLHKDIIAEMSVFPRDKILALLKLDHLDNLDKEVDEVSQNVTYSRLRDYINGLLNEAALMATSKEFPFDGAKGLMFIRSIFNFLLRNPAVNNITRSHEELLGFVNDLLYSANNSQNLIRRIQDLSGTLPFVQRDPTEIGNLVRILTQNSFADILERSDFNNSIFHLRNSTVTSVMQRLFRIFFGDSRAGYTPWPYIDIHDVLKSVFEENDDFKQVEKVIEVLFSFLMLSRKAVKETVTVSKILENLNVTENLNPLEMSYLALQKAVRRAVGEKSLKEEAHMLYLNKGQLDSLENAFFDLTSMMIPLNAFSLKKSDTAVVEGALAESLSQFSDAFEEEIAKFLTSALNYSIMLERLVDVVANSIANSSEEASKLVENMLDFLVSIKDMIQRNNSKLNLTQALKQEKGDDEIQKVISYFLEMQSLEREASVKAEVPEEFWSNSSEQDPNRWITLLKRQDGILTALGLITELIDFTSDFTNGDLNTLSFLTSPVVQNAVKLSVLPALEEMFPLIGLPHLNKNQKGSFVQDLLQTILRLLFNESRIQENRMLNVKLLQYLVLPLLVGQRLNDWRINEVCQVLHKHLTPEGATLLLKLEAAALNALTTISDNPAFTTNLQCVFKSCKNGFPRQFLFSVLEGIYLVQGHYQHTEETLSSSAQGICENLVYLKKKLSATLAAFQRGLYRATDEHCECRRDSESIQRHMEKLTETLQAPVAGNPLMAFLHNFSLPADVKIKDCMQNATEVAQELRSLSNISDKTINMVMESSISYPKFLSGALTAALVGRCDVEALSPFLTFPSEDHAADAVKEICSLPPQELYTMAVLLLQNLSVRNVVYKIKLPSEVDKLLDMLLDVVSNVSSLLKKAQRIFENLPAFLRTLKSTSVLDISAFQLIFQNRQFRSLTVGSLQSLIKGVCKEDSSFFSSTNMFIDMPRITEVLEEDMAKFSIPEDSTQFCLQLYQEILQSPNGALIWTFLKPLLHGKILYTPNTKNINLVMQKANRTFGFVADLKTYSEAWLRMTELVKHSENFLMVSQLQEALQNTFIKNFVESQLDLDVGKLMGKLQMYETAIEKMLNNSATEQISLLAQFMGNLSSCLLLDRFQPVESVEKLEAKAHELMQQNNFLASVIFDASDTKRGGADIVQELPKHVSYTIRTSILHSLRTDLIKNPAWKSHPQNLPADGFKYNHVFIPLQDMIERAIVSVHTGVDALDAGIQVQAMPYPCHTSDLFLNNIGFFFPLIMMLTWMVSVASMVRKLVYEREIHLEEYMRTMGVPPSIHFLAWFLENVVVLTISCCALTVILRASGIFAYSDGFLVFLFFLDFGVSIAMFSYLLSVFFASANTAALCGSLLYMISFLPYVILLVLQNQLSFANQTFVCFLSTTAFGQGVFLLTLLEGHELGIQWNNIYQPLAKGGPMTFGWACWMILLDSVIYFIIGWYFSNIIPGRFGLRKPWYFPFTLTYWKNMCGVRTKKQPSLNPALFFVNESFRRIGSLPQELEKGGEEENPIGVLLKSLTKEYTESNKTAVKDLSLAFYKGHITALLGPNGAGKTTVISMLTGLFPPSSGNIIINGKDMETDLAAIWTEMGVCPQYDVLFDSLTVREHLLLYGTVKVPLWTKEQLHQHVTRALQDVGLFQHRCKYIRALSGGMKRRLSIAIAFIGNSKTVVLDEPTSSIDPCSRRSIWDILLKYKAGRTLIFTTHHLDEAEALSDRIAILQHGQLSCCGSPSYLKEMYGQGHSLTFTKKPSVFATEDPCDTLRVTALVQAYIPEALLKENSGSELTYMIPAEADKAAFKGLFQALDENLPYLHVTGYGISDTTLEKVFLKLLQSSEKTSETPVVVDMKFSQADIAESTHKNGNSLMEAPRVRGARLVLNQIAALLMKRLRHTRRDWRGTLSSILLPVLFVAMAMALFTVKPLAIDYPSLKLTPGLYDNAETFFSGQGDGLSHMLMRYFTDEDDLCVHSRREVNNPCWKTTAPPQQEPLPWCECAADQETCPAFNISAPYMKNKKGHTLYNLSALSIEEYLIRPSNKARFGGWSFGETLSTEPQTTGIKKPHHKLIAKVWYNQKGFHALPSYLNQLNNLILWKNLPSDVDWKQYGITLHSCPYGGALLDEDKIMENVRQCGVALCIVLGFSILTASIGSSIVNDRTSGAKRLQHISGLGYKTYWIANFLYDMLLYLVPVSLCIGVITVFQLSAFTFRENLAATALLLILFGYTTLPWMYLMSRFFASSDIAFISYVSLNFVCGLCTMLVTLLPRLLAVISKGKSFQNIYNVLKWTFIIFPQFCLGQGLIELAYNQIKFDLTSNFGINSYVTPFEMDFLGWIFTEMALQGTLLLLLRVLLNWDLLQKPRDHRCITNTFVPSSEDKDVELERKRLFGGGNGNDLLLLYNLQKSYPGFSKRNTAVKGITLGIQRGECFGLLGANGAGKSTTFKMLTGDVIPSAGRAVIQTPTGSELDILSALSQGVRIGYCPQQDALDALLTGWEHLYYYCSLRGIPQRHVREVAGDLVSRLHLDAHADELVGTYSGGTKRKLSTALALVGKPHVLLLDEPSSGMDPCSKRYLWNTITKEVQDGCAAVLTSHSMEECEALCTRLAIMVNGRFKCLGSPQHIKNRFGDGYSVKVWLSKGTNSQKTITECLRFHFPGACFKGQHLNLLEYCVPQNQGYLAELFRVLESNRMSLQIKHYSISQTTLEQVFINFATQDQEDPNSAQGSRTSHDCHLPASA